MLSAIDVMYIVREMKEQIEDSKIVKVYSKGKDITIELFKSGKGRLLLRIIPGIAIFITKDKDTTDIPNPFAMTLRKKLKQGKLLEIKQIDSERIVELRIDKLRLIVELFGKGNIVLVDNEDKILSCIDNQEWKDRTVKKGEIYKRPPGKADLFKLEPEEFKVLADKSDKDSIVKVLAVDFGLGSRYAEEVCRRAQVDKSKRNRVDIHKIHREVMNLKNERLSPSIMEYDGTEVVPIELESRAEIPRDTFITFSQALDRYFRSLRLEEAEVGKDKLIKVAEIQKERAKELEEESVLFKEIADKIYANYEIINNLINEVKETRWTTKNPLILEKNRKEGKIIIEL
ncbi:MAG TPA: NFACT family protein [Candidatus Nanoarchaeia archaeon]|nr:NFACT family protein [Candidatus Nanoarchaeia archaeon]